MTTNSGEELRAKCTHVTHAIGINATNPFDGNCMICGEQALIPKLRAEISQLAEQLRELESQMAYVEYFNLGKDTYVSRYEGDDFVATGNAVKLLAGGQRGGHDLRGEEWQKAIRCTRDEAFKRARAYLDAIQAGKK